MRRPSRWLRASVVAALAAMTAAGAPAPAPPPAIPAAAAPATRTPAPRFKRPRFKSPEYLRSWGLTAVNASAAYRAGASGRGVTIALIDCGLQDAQPEVVRNVSPQSTDVISGRQASSLSDRHADFMAGPLGSALNGRGLLGVAYNATLLSVRADMEGGWQGQCAFRPKDLARALDYATDHGARVIVLPLQAEHPLGAPFEAALQRVVDRGAAVVIAAGNGAAERPSWPGLYAADPRYAGAVLVVGATTYDGVLTDWSNKAGEAQRYYLAAPGARIVTDCGKKWCKLVSGTSFAAPYVAGALALVMEAHPGLDGRAAIARVLDGARDVGEPGTDAVYGRGVLDIGRTFEQTAAQGRPKGG